MNLVIDIGNSMTKWAVFRNKEILVSSHSPDISINTIEQYLKEYPELNYSIVSSVRKRDEKLIQFLQRAFKSALELSDETPLPIGNLYKSKNSLGYDRIAAAVGANSLFTDTNVLIIDTGTAITVDLVNATNQYAGGNISPGLQMRFKALHDYTANLPYVEYHKNHKWFGTNTHSAIVAGVHNSIIFELEGYINRLKKRYDDLKVIITGGDAHFFDNKLKSSIFVDSNLNLKGLNRILEYNVEIL